MADFGPAGPHPVMIHSANATGAGRAGMGSSVLIVAAPNRAWTRPRY